jgi:hypothetical protein
MFKVRVQVVLYKNSVDQVKILLDSIVSSALDISGKIQIVCGSNGASKGLNDTYASLLQQYSTEIDTKFISTEVNLVHVAMHNK